jgi:hypothetical protein
MAFAPIEASAQDDSCKRGAELLKSRQGLLARFQGGGKRKLTPGEACSALSSLSANGNALLAWIKKDGAWCNVPSNMEQGLRGQHAQIVRVRGQACSAASKQAQLLRLARQQQQQQQQSPYGPDDVTGGPRRLPAGAL